MQPVTRGTDEALPLKLMQGRSLTFSSAMPIGIHHCLKQIKDLHVDGYRIWYDEGIGVSSEWPEEIARAVLGCWLLVYVSRSHRFGQLQE